MAKNHEQSAGLFSLRALCRDWTAMRSDEELFSGLHIVDADTILTQVADFE